MHLSYVFAYEFDNWKCQIPKQYYQYKWVKQQVVSKRSFLPFCWGCIEELKNDSQNYIGEDSWSIWSDGNLSKIGS